MSSGKQYTIRTVGDFVAVPEDRVAACLAEFAEFLTLAREVSELTRAAGGVVVHCEFPEYTWIDDGRRDVSVMLETRVECGAGVTAEGKGGKGVLQR